MKRRVLVAIGFLATIILPLFPSPRAHADNTKTVSSVIISEVKLGGDSYSQGASQPKDPQEFITLYNQSGSAVDLTGWTLEYAKPTFDKTYCSNSDWTEHNVSGSASQTVLSGSLQPGQASTPIARSLTDNTDGSLHLVNASDPNNVIIEDLVGWGSSAPCFDTAATTTPSNGKSLKRYLDCNNLPVDTNNNTQDFAANQPPSPGALNYPYLSTCQDNSGGSTTPPTTQPTCEGVLISELLPNPAGSDTGNEFIELYNPTSAAISLQGCSLQTTASSKIYNFANIGLQPGEYHAFYDSTTGLTLSNAAGGTAWLLSPSTELQAITYPGNLDDNVAWVRINSSWQASYQPTPNAANVLVTLKPCAEGDVRNPSTGYCDSVAILTTSTLTVCKPGQERNPATNRCRSVTSSTTTSGLTPCKPGQERNPATNRCKAVATIASASLKPCAANQERNPATNRCRKVSSIAGGSLADAKDTLAGTGATAGGGSTHWWIAGVAIIGALGYGTYEWRQEIGQYFSQFKAKLPGFSSK